MMLMKGESASRSLRTSICHSRFEHPRSLITSFSSTPRNRCSSAQSGGCHVLNETCVVDYPLCPGWSASSSFSPSSSSFAIISKHNLIFTDLASNRTQQAGPFRPSWPSAVLSPPHPCRCRDYNAQAKPHRRAGPGDTVQAVLVPVCARVQILLDLWLLRLLLMALVAEVRSRSGGNESRCAMENVREICWRLQWMLTGEEAVHA